MNNALFFFCCQHAFHDYDLLLKMIVLQVLIEFSQILDNFSHSADAKKLKSSYFIKT